MEEFINMYDDTNWVDAQGYPGGTKKKVLYDENGTEIVLLKFPKGFYMNPHSHITKEQHFILKGEYISEGRVFPEGTYRRFDAHETHGPFESKEGVLVLAIWIA